MRILHVTDHYAPVLGGIETHIAGLAARQVARGDEVTVLTPIPRAADGRHTGDRGPVRVRRAGSVAAVRSSDLAGYDVIHAHVSVVAPFTAPITSAAARSGTPTVVTVHSLWNGMGPVPTLAAALAGLRGAPVQWTAVSRVAADQVRRRLPAGTDVRVLPNAVEVAPRAVTPTRAGAPVQLVSTMRIARRKRPLPLVDLFAALRATTDVPVELTVVGDGPLRPALERRVRLAGLADAVTVTGRLEPADVLAHLVSADLYVAPAILESFGLAALEARCVGLPVVGHAASGLSEFVRDGVEGALCASDADLLTRLRALVEDEVTRRGICEHNRVTPSPLTWAHTVALHDAAYALAPSRQPPRARGSRRLRYALR